MPEGLSTSGRYEPNRGRIHEIGVLGMLIGRKLVYSPIASHHVSLAPVSCFRLALALDIGMPAVARLNQHRIDAEFAIPGHQPVRLRFAGPSSTR